MRIALHPPCPSCPVTSAPLTLQSRGLAVRRPGVATGWPSSRQVLVQGEEPLSGWLTLALELGVLVHMTAFVPP